MVPKRSARALPLLLACLLLPPAALHAQETEAQPPAPLEAELTAEAIQARITALEAATDLDADTRTQASAALQEALAELGRAAEFAAQAEAFEQEAAAAPEQLAAIREELARPLLAPEAVAPADATAAQIDQLVTKAEQQLAAGRDQLEQLRAEQARRGERRAALDEQMATSQQRVQDQEGVQTLSDAAPLPIARALRLLAQQRSARQQLRAQEAEFANYEARRELLPAKIDRAGRRVALAEKALDAWHAIAAERRRAEAATAMRDAERLRLETALGSKEMQALAEGNQELALLRSGTDLAPGTVARLATGSRRVAELRDLLTKVRERFDSVSSKVEAAGLTNSMGLLLRKELETLPNTAALREQIRLRQDVISDLQYQLIVRGEERSQAGDIEQQLSPLLEGVATSSPQELADLERVGRELLSARRDLLHAVLEDYEKLFARLIELDTVTRQAAETTVSYRSYIEERILWVRSVAGSTVPNLDDARSAVAWLVKPASWAAGCRAALTGLVQHWLEVLFGALAIAGVLFSRFWSRGRVRAMAGVVESDATDAFAYTARASLIVLVRATAFPALLWGVGWALATPPKQPDVVLASAAGLNAAAFALFAYELLRQVLLPGSLGQVHFRWPSEVCAHIRAHLRWFVPVQLVTVFVVTTLDVQRQSDLWNDSLGRITFMIGLLALALFLQRVLRPSGPVFAEHLRATPQGWLSRLRYVWYPLAVGGPLALALGAWRGYYYTALQLEARFETWLWLLLALVLANAVFLRWLRVARRKLLALARRDAEEAASVAAAPPAPDEPSPTTPASAAEPVAAAGAVAAEPAPPRAEVEEEEDADVAADVVASSASAAEAQPAARAKALIGVQLSDELGGRLGLSEIDQQTRKLFHSALVLVIIIGSYMIWADVLPALRRLEQIQIYPTLQLAPKPQLAAAALDGLEPAVIATEALSKVVTLADLLLSLVILGFTVAAARNVPGLLEILVLRRLPLDPGGRYAAISLARYAIVLVGVPLSLSRVGINWGSVQWLAAAFTFGLAFGLQEIFANFVSGLIILLERPVRVGDLVTVAGTNGVVTRIRMRATTITDFDRKELIVPNKLFVTASVLNWALSDEIIRVVLPVGVAYGSKVERAREIMLRAAREHALVLEEPGPSCFFVGMGDSALNFELRVFVEASKNKMPVQHEVLRAIYEALGKARIEIPFPQRDLHLRSAEEPLLKALRREAPKGGEGG